MEQLYIKDKEGNKVLPITSESAVRDANGNPLSSKLVVINDALDARYTKSETYSKSQLDSLITTPNQKYVTVEDYASLPESGEADTIYRVSNWDGSLATPATDITKYSEYAWDGTGYVFLNVKSQIGEIYDISANHSGATYADLASALGTNGANVPNGIRKGGMSIKFVQTSDNNYVQYRYMGTDATTAATFTNVTNWQSENFDDEPISGSPNAVKGAGLAPITMNKVQQLGFYIVDDLLNIIMKYDNDGLDFTKISEHALNILRLYNISSFMSVTQEKGFYIVDNNLNIGIKVDNYGVNNNKILNYKIINI